MHFQVPSPRSLYSTILGAAMLGALLGGCSGGGSSALPQSSGGPAIANLAEQPIGTQSINRGSEIGATVTGSAAFYMPMAGGSIRPISLPVNHSGRASHPLDLTNFGGPTVRTASSINIYVNCASTCWGNPATFLTQWAPSNFAHLLDQYTGSTASNRYTYGGAVAATYNTSGTLQDQDIYNIVHAVAQAHGAGYTHIYHVFLAKGVKQCSVSAGGCYGVNGGYCAYHGATDYSDIGHTLYSVEGYQGIAGCNVPDNKLSDDTASTLSHELYETITDPDVQTNAAWYNNANGEIGDECASSIGFVTLSGTQYQLQREYSNKYHACSFTP